MEGSRANEHFGSTKRKRSILLRIVKFVVGPIGFVYLTLRSALFPSRSERDIADGLRASADDDMDRATVFFIRAAETDPTAWLVRSHLSRAIEAGVRLEEIAALCERITHGTPENNWARYHRALSLLRLGRGREARVEFETVAQSKSRWSSDAQKYLSTL